MKIEAGQKQQSNPSEQAENRPELFKTEIYVSRLLESDPMSSSDTGELQLHSVNDSTRVQSINIVFRDWADGHKLEEILRASRSAGKKLVLTISEVPDK